MFSINKENNMQFIGTKDAQSIARLNEPVQNLHCELYPERFKPYDFESVHAYFTKVVNKETHHFIIGQDLGFNTGYVWFEEIFRAETAFSKATHYVYVHQISVSPKYRGRGIGKALFACVKEFCYARSVDRIGLDYWVENQKAKEIYEGMGFEPQKEVSYLNL